MYAPTVDACKPKVIHNRSPTPQLCGVGIRLLSHPGFVGSAGGSAFCASSSASNVGSKFARSPEIRTKELRIIKSGGSQNTPACAHSELNILAQGSTQPKYVTAEPK